ncbi:MAG: FAD:protein FMN transferase [Chloroflexi bacterium HGW-Chloroflexi-4]|jgi:thiamine biosynthesis lipoprotein|nr:MAG: FAD:protein FMN transferase [Chloroflexi bacterium HGW-Chloroflexi-4]
MKTITFHAMGSRILIAMDTEDLNLINEVFKSRDWFEEWEESFSRFRLTSELSQFNRHAGTPQKVSESFFEVATLARNISHETNGLINPLILNSLQTAGYTEDFEKLITVTDKALRLPNTLVANGSQEFEIDDKKRTVTIPYGTQLDFGGFAKGWAAHQTMLRLQSFAPVLVDAGGDIAVSSRLLDGSEWPIGVADPINKENNLGLLMIAQGGVATSGRDYRKWFTNNRWQHHLIDTRTNQPADSDVYTATVVAKDLMLAEMNAKMGVILGSTEGAVWLNAQPNVDYLLVLENGEIMKSAGFIERQWNERWNQITHNQSI